MILITLIIILGILFYFVYGIFNIQFNLFIPSIHKINTSEKIVFLSFDDSPHPINTPLILEILRINNIKATFFSIGKNIENHPEVFQQIIEDGHSIGNHSYSHNIAFTFHNATNVFEDIKRCQVTIQKYTSKPIRFFRPPFGVTNPSIAKAVNQTGLISIGWLIRSYDTLISNKDHLIKRVLKKLKPGAIILLHDSGICTIHALQEMIDLIKEKGYKIDNLDNFVKYNSKAI